MRCYYGILTSSWNGSGMSNNVLDSIREKEMKLLFILFVVGFILWHLLVSFLSAGPSYETEKKWMKKLTEYKSRERK